MRARRVQNSDELVVTKAKRMAKELFAELEPDARKKKLDNNVCWSVNRWQPSLVLSFHTCTTFHTRGLRCDASVLLAT